MSLRAPLPLVARPHERESKANVGPPRRSKLLCAEELLYLAKLSGPVITRQAFDEYAPIGFLEDAIVEQHQQATIVQRANKPSETLL